MVCRLLYNATYKKNLRKFSGDGKSLFQLVSQSVCCMPVCLSPCQLVSLSVRMSACLSVCQSFIHSVCLSVCLPYCHSVFLSDCLSVCLSVYQASSGSIDLVTTSLLEDKFVFFARSSFSRSLSLGL